MAVILSCFLGVPTVSSNWLFFSMFSASFLKKALFRPFVFKMFSGLGVCVVSGHKVAMQSGPVRLGRCGIINPFLLPVRGGGAQDRARLSAVVLPVLLMARASPE